MCEQCLAATIGWDIFPSDKGPILVQATRDGHEMKKSQWGLVFMNGPFVIWDTTPIPDPGDPPDLDSDSEEFEELETGFLRALHSFREEFRMTPTEGYRLYTAAVGVGFGPGDGGFECWLFDRMGRAVKERPEGDSEVSTPDDDEGVPEGVAVLLDVQAKIKSMNPGELGELLKHSKVNIPALLKEFDRIRQKYP